MSNGKPTTGLTKATDEQQARVWRLRALIQCVHEAPRDQIEDLDAAISGLADYAGAIHSALDAGVLGQRAQEIAEEVSHG